MLFAWIALLLAAPAHADDDDIQLIPQGTTTSPAPPTRSAPSRAAPRPAPAPAPAPTPAPAPAPAEDELEIRGMHCVPDVKEVELRRPIPISCTVDYPVSGVELRYRSPGQKWEKVEFSQADASYTGTIPCAATSAQGTLDFYIFARNTNNKVIARVGRRETPLSVRLVEHTKRAPPSLPGQKAPERCYDPNQCPPELLGTQACPGTQAPKAPPKKGWGATCAATSECGSGFECIKGSCEEPAKCEDSKECSDGGECVDGRCHIPDAEELKSDIGPAKHHWIGLHAGMDVYFGGQASGVCGLDTMSSDAQRYTCFDGGNEYAGTPNLLYGGHISSKVYLATIRAMLSYDYMVGRISVGGRLGWAFNGAPKHFSPIHIEARASYSLRKDPFKKTFRPYLGISMGHAQVDAKGATAIVDCVSQDPGCINAKTPDEINMYLQGPNAQAIIRKLDAYRSGSPFFFGPTLTLMYALANDSAIVFNLNAMFPTITIEPSIGYQLGL